MSLFLVQWTGEEKVMSIFDFAATTKRAIYNVLGVKVLVETTAVHSKSCMFNIELTVTNIKM